VTLNRQPDRRTRQGILADVKAGLQKFSRWPEQLLDMQGILPVLGGTQAEARANYEALKALVHAPVA
jgi:alkanesulfonate monooxygenase SsuD/methylene tetrahydromethanopterin reductase-like flavin-dependent oxidoreductase (luciferase family)